MQVGLQKAASGFVRKSSTDLLASTDELFVCLAVAGVKKAVGLATKSARGAVFSHFSVCWYKKKLMLKK